jgi:hypothetical protein
VLELLRSVGDQRATETAHRAWLLTYRDRADAIAEIRDPVLAVVGKARCGAICMRSDMLVFGAVHGGSETKF